MKVKIPFMERFKDPMIAGVKTWTSRSRRYGKAGDTFEDFGHEFKIFAVRRKPLYDILNHWKEEGLASREEAVEVWKGLHPYRRFDLSELFYTHIFGRISS